MNHRHFFVILFTSALAVPCLSMHESTFDADFLRNVLETKINRELDFPKGSTVEIVQLMSSVSNAFILRAEGVLLIKDFNTETESISFHASNKTNRLFNQFCAATVREQTESTRQSFQSFQFFQDETRNHLELINRIKEKLKEVRN